MKRTRNERIRLGLFFGLVCLFFAGIGARLFQLQILNGAEYDAIVSRQSSSRIEIPAARGLICDRGGRIVANNVSLSSLYAYPTSKAQVKNVGRYLDRFFGLPSGTSEKKHRLKPNRFRYIRRCIDDATALKLEDDAPLGLHLRKESQREYPYGLVGKQIVGYTDIDDNGQSGIELEYDSMLSGIPGQVDAYRDGLRDIYKVQEEALVEPQPGQSMVLTIDWRLQEIVEEELKAAVVEYNAENGLAAFMDCRNGDIMAMAHYDPTEKNPQKPIKLRAVTDQFEPGSVFKVITVAGLMDASVVDYADSVYCEEGLWMMGRRRLRDDKKHGWLKFREVVELSSNIGIGKYTVELGGEELFATAKRFGFGDKFDIGLPSETGGYLVSPNRWSEFTISSLAMGHAVAVSALQMAAAFAAVANGGELLQPRLVMGLVDRTGTLVPRGGRDVIRRAMKQSSADSLHAFLRGVVERGTATLVNSEIVKIAGKTGTAQIPDLENHRYFQNRFMASFAGFFPYDEPQLAGIVVLTNPQPIHYGGHTAGPAFRRIAERYSILNPDKFTPPERLLAETSSELHQATEIPDFVGHPVVRASAIAAMNRVNYRCNADSGIVVWQFPPAGRLALAGEEMLLAIGNAIEPGPVMADLKGLSMRKAMAFLNWAGVPFEVSGRGNVRSQSISAGENLSQDVTCRLVCRSI